MAYVVKWLKALTEWMKMIINLFSNVVQKYSLRQCANRQQNAALQVMERFPITKGHENVHVA